MNKQCIYVPFAVLVAALAACSAPAQKDIPALTAGIDAANAGHYRQAIMHEEIAEEKLEEADEALAHWKKDHYWNINDRQKALDAAREAAEHRLASEKEMCQWLTQVHSQNHLKDGSVSAQYSAVFFADGSAVPYKSDEHEIAILGSYLETHPEVTAEVNAYTDTVGSAASNQHLSERRAAYVRDQLIKHGAKLEQLNIKMLGEAHGPDNVRDQSHRTVSMVTVHPTYADCSNLK
ncbi:MAG: OmpA family protein [Methylobacter tundripaludum]|uniref:Outer membrane protein OmpA-like peptidoglycan-associated protein n=1 Tax=Methylobacter tundripaludum TaxID=173365 RepID=A0A2S6H017_9GAMM|nr:OmpA family protein [Methylobacter tundripaludum]MCK9634694.1 OmpA family protein [Methylobacter tundripaludum]PPK70761.1 outer membrane protein OmpA-like peptidoglycan-associated protein [Methylobacter tundripaludum]